MIQTIHTNKNKLVISHEGSQIRKYFTSPEEFSRELQIYKQNPSFAPRLVGYNEKDLILILQYLEAETILQIEPDFGKIAQLFYKLHSFKKQTICLCDVNPKNILFDIPSRRYYLIDFSDWQFQPKEYDLVRFLLFWASIFPYDKFQEKATMFFDSYNQLFAIDYSLIQKFLHPAIVEFDTRRKKYNRKKAIITAEPDKNRQWISEIITKQI
jgi:thiamine kinase-like enzyme